eukprot:TRINITY_DN960_c0_g1_i2.p1 TRINITY_DN960_c0_g1~~TRINITY_DN960_c0_g1_i2.p1  ORF type:complete len:267 (+),score=31.78 TRINITY_DN960_c0_g1_i2:38-802(+)
MEEIATSVAEQLYDPIGLNTLATGFASFVFLVIASWCVGEGGEILGEKYDASIIGGLVIAWLNTAPETIFFVTALNTNNPLFAVGAMSGSTIVVCTVAMGACLFLGCTARKSKNFTLQPAVKIQCYILSASVIVPLITIYYGFNWFCAAGGALAYCAFLIYSLLAKKPNSFEDKVEDIELGEEYVEVDEEEHDVSVTKGIIYLCIGGLMIFVFSNPFINAVVLSAKKLQISPTLLAFFLAPIASEGKTFFYGNN